MQNMQIALVSFKDEAQISKIQSVEPQSVDVIHYLTASRCLSLCPEHAGIYVQSSHSIIIGVLLFFLLLLLLTPFFFLPGLLERTFP